MISSRPVLVSPISRPVAGRTSIFVTISDRVQARDADDAASSGGIVPGAALSTLTMAPPGASAVGRASA